MDNVPKKNLGESIRARLRNLAGKRGRPFDEILRYYAMERFLYRLSISEYAKQFFLKGGLMLKVWDSLGHRSTIDIDLLARLKVENLRKSLVHIAAIQIPEDALFFDTQYIILRETQTGGDYHGMSASFSAMLDTTKIPILIDIGFNDLPIPEPEEILYPSLLQMTEPRLRGYAFETVIAEKLESIVKLGLVNTRMKDFYDLWSICRRVKLNSERLQLTITKVFANRKTKIQYPIAFTKNFYDSPRALQLWTNFLSSLGEDLVDLSSVVDEISHFLSPFLQESKP